MYLTTCPRPDTSLSRLFSLQHELDRLFSAEAARPFAPALDIAENKDAYLVRAELPGLQREDISVALEDNVLTVSGERKLETEAEGTTVHRRERYYGQFQRVLELPTTVVADKVTAQFKDGVLTITLPKSEAAKPKKIDVSLN